jgi:DNA-directed RNA polymerase II subunit RPB2
MCALVHNLTPARVTHFYDSYYLSYQAPIFVDMTMKTNTDERKVPKVHIGSVPIMLRSKYCLLADVPIRDLPLLKECPYDEGM